LQKRHITLGGRFGHHTGLDDEANGVGVGIDVGEVDVVDGSVRMAMLEQTLVMQAIV
jgi:hypothetical protein